MPRTLPKSVRNKAEKLRAQESWPLYDTILIGSEVPSQPGWYPSFQAAAQETELSFFNMRNRSQVGPQYCNLDTSEQLDFAYEIDSIGVDFLAPPSSQGRNVTGSFVSDSDTPFGVFMGDLIRHASLSLVLNQDEKLNAPLSALPSGIGPTGGMNRAHPQVAAPQAVINQAGIQGQITNGQPVMTNRWPFPKPIRVPRNHNLRAVIRLSEWGRYMLNELQGPYNIFMGNNAQAPEDGIVPAVCAIRVTLIGNRFVQLRNAQSFY